MKIKIVCLSLCLVLAGCGLDEATVRSDKPVSREVAIRSIDVPLPVSATNVYYLFHAGGMQEMDLFVRFMVGSNELNEAINSILLDHDSKMKQHYSYPSCAIAVAPQHTGKLLPNNLAPMPWWNPDSITNGLYRGTTNGPTFGLWIDISRHVIYLHSTD